MVEYVEVEGEERLSGVKVGLFGAEEAEVATKPNGHSRIKE